MGGEVALDAALAHAKLPRPVFDGGGMAGIAVQRQRGPLHPPLRRSARRGNAGRDDEGLVPTPPTHRVAPPKAWPAEIETIYDAADSDDLYPLETIAAANPDLIIVIGEDSGGCIGDYYDRLSAIAAELAGETTAEQDDGTW